MATQHTVEFDYPDGSKILLPVGPPTYVAPPAPKPAPKPSPVLTPLPTSGVKVGALLALYDFVNDPTAFDKVSHSWFNGGSMNSIATDPANAVQGPNGIDLWLRNGKGSLINSNPNDASKPGFQFGAGYLEFFATFANAEVKQPTINYHSSKGANNGPTVSGNWLGNAHAFAIDRTTSQAIVWYDETQERTYAIDDADAPHYWVANVGKDGWSSVWDTGQTWPQTGEDDDAEDPGPGTAPDGIYLTIHAIRAWAAA